MRKNFSFSLERTLPIFVGFLPVGIAYGILMADAGYNFIWSGLTSLIVLAGSLQFLMIPFFEGNTPLYTVIILALLLNSRHIFYGLGYTEKFNEFGRWKYFAIYCLADESYSMLCSYRPAYGVEENKVHLLSFGLIWFYWVFASTLGGLIGQAIPFPTEGIDFTLTALFTVILTDQLRGAPKKLPFFAALLSSILCLAIFGASGFILPSLILTVSALIALRPYMESPKKSNRK